MSAAKYKLYFKWNELRGAYLLQPYDTAGLCLSGANEAFGEDLRAGDSPVSGFTLYVYESCPYDPPSEPEVHFCFIPVRSGIMIADMDNQDDDVWNLYGIDSELESWLQQSDLLTGKTYTAAVYAFQRVDTTRKKVRVSFDVEMMSLPLVSKHTTSPTEIGALIAAKSVTARNEIYRILGDNGYETIQITNRTSTLIDDGRKDKN